MIPPSKELVRIPAQEKRSLSRAVKISTVGVIHAFEAIYQGATRNCDLSLVPFDSGVSTAQLDRHFKLDLDLHPQPTMNG